MSTHAKTLLTPEQYLEIERKAEFKSEYHDGEMFAMSGAQEAHILIAMNAGTSLNSQFRGRPCRVYGSDMRVCARQRRSYFYPDISALCGQPIFLEDRRDNLVNPNLVIEVLSPSTEAYDRGRKFELYRGIQSLTQYVLISTEHVHVDVFTRGQSGSWTLTSADKLDATIELTSVDAVLRLADLYDKTEVRELPE